MKALRAATAVLIVVALLVVVALRQDSRIPNLSCRDHLSGTSDWAHISSPNVLFRSQRDRWRLSPAKSSR